ncbi:MATE family efflux transporter [Candidatus Epulonipiscium viviparus]|uniref:MATE family efflux transporter n=1 Tax=Candidatus Epulonipiscium viviparus TaxID=420336 RepID=UPI00049785CF|nr:MATE family efflux transporter [Candidatus Epulopiscium viviparus]
MALDMTKGNPLRLLLVFSIPLIIGNIFQQIYAIVDTIIVGKFVGALALAGVGTTGAIFFLVNTLIIGMTSGFSILISQRFGAQDTKGVRYAVASAIILTIGITIIVTFLMLFLIDPLLELINTPADIYGYADTYITIIILGIFTQTFYNMAAGILRAIGDSRTPIYFLILACIINIVLDLLFILQFDLGVAGAAYATNVAQGISALLCVIYSYTKFNLLKLKKDDFQIPKEYFVTHLKMGIPMSIQYSVLSLGIMIVQGAINSFGSLYIAAYTAANKVLNLSLQPLLTYGVALATYVGQNKGAQNFQRIKSGVNTAAAMNIITSIIIWIILTLFSRDLLSLFLDESATEMLDNAVMVLNYVSPFYAAVGFIFIYRNAIQSMGRPFVPMVSGAMELTARIIVAYTLPSWIGFAGICLADPIAWIVGAIPLIIAYYREMNKIFKH